MEQMERTMKTEKVFDGKILSVRVDTVELPGQKYSKREIVEHAPAVGVVACDKEDNIILIKQYRKAVNRVIYEIPAGLLEIGESPKDCAIRELKEETGYSAGKVDYSTEFFSSPGFTTEKIYIFFAEDLEEGEQNLDDGEYVEIEKMPIEKAIKMVQVGEIMDSKSIIGILMYNKFRGEQ